MTFLTFFAVLALDIAQSIVCKLWTHNGALCTSGVYIAPKNLFTLMVSVWYMRIYRAFLSCSVYQKRASSRAQCVLYIFTFKNR